MPIHFSLLQHQDNGQQLVGPCQLSILANCMCIVQTDHYTSFLVISTDTLNGENERGKGETRGNFPLYC